MIQIHKLPTLYKRDSTGKIREWTQSYQTGITPGTFTISGVKNGKMVQSGLNSSEAKNVGRSNATTDQEQAMAEAKAKWDIKLEAEYFENVSPNYKLDYSNIHEKTGLDCAKWLINNFYDVKADKINRPYKAGLDSFVKQETKLSLYFTLNFIGVVFAFLKFVCPPQKTH